MRFITGKERRQLRRRKDRAERNRRKSRHDRRCKIGSNGLFWKWHAQSNNRRRTKEEAKYQSKSKKG